jgi:CubicO group peptidase (beta-lactamase class C family)
MSPRRLTKVTVLVASVLTMSRAEAQSPATKRAREVVAVINAATPAAIRAFVDSAFDDQMRGMPMRAHIDFFMGQREQSGGLEWVEVQDEKPAETTALLKRKLTGELIAVLVRTNPAAPYRIGGIGQRPPRPKVAQAEPRITTDAELTTALGDFVNRLVRADLFSGTVLLAKDGKRLYGMAFGEANKDFGVPNALDTKFNLGSMNKMFTAVTVAQLVEQGKLSYDDPLSKFMPDFPSADAARKIRIKHLLTHTSGLGSYFNDEFDRTSRAKYRTVDEMLTLAKNEKLAFEPGARWSYSNTGMLVLGKVIEVVTRQDYFDYVREHLYKPAGMRSTDAYQLDEVNRNLAVGYQREYADDGTKRFRNNIFMHVIRGGPAGGGYSTAEDLVRFAESLKASKLVSAATYELLTTPKPDVNSPDYGYGFGVNSQTGIVGHSGGFPGISSNLDIFKGSGYVAVVMSNYGGASQPVVEKIRTLVKARTAGTPAQ